MHYVEVTVARSVMHASEQTGTKSTCQSANMTLASPHYFYCVDGNWLFHLVASVSANDMDLLTA